MISRLEAVFGPRQRLALAWDKGSFGPSDRDLLGQLLPHLGIVKVGYEALFSLTETSTVALEVVHFLRGTSAKLMLDAKLKDIDNTVIKAVKAILKWPQVPQILTIHATVKLPTIIGALEAAKGSGMLITGVTALTDHSDDECRNIYGNGSIEVVVEGAQRLAEASKKTGELVGIVCSPKELQHVKEFNLVNITPGIRGKDEPPGGQARTMSPYDAVRAGSDILVVGRPILDAPDPVAAARSIAAEIDRALAPILA